MSKYDFDAVVDRRDTGAVKYESLCELFGRADVTPMWIADMEFAVCPDIVEAMKRRAGHPIYGYSVAGEGYWNSICDWLERRHNFRPEREQLAFVPGVVRGIAYALNFFTRPGDKVVIQPRCTIRSVSSPKATDALCWRIRSVRWIPIFTMIWTSNIWSTCSLRSIRV